MKEETMVAVRELSSVQCLEDFWLKSTRFLGLQPIHPYVIKAFELLFVEDGARSITVVFLADGGQVVNDFIEVFEQSQRTRHLYLRCVHIIVVRVG